MKHEQLHKIIVPVKGMHCASCSYSIEKTLKKDPAVVNCEVNYATEKASIEYDPKQVTLEDLNKKIEPLGYSFHIPAKQPLHHIMPDGTIMQNDGENSTDHSSHLGLNQTKKDKLKELDELKSKVKISMPLVIFSFFVMGWEILASYKLAPEMMMEVKEFFHHVLPLMATYVLFVTGIPYLKGVSNFIRYKVANMDTLVGIGTLTAYLYSIIVAAFETTLSRYIDTSHTYYDVTIIVIGFITLGKYLETKSKVKTSEALEKLLNMQAKTAIIESAGNKIEIPLDQVVLNDLVIVKPGAKVPVDGEIVEGTTSIDESMLTGESLPTDKKVGDLVIGGTINKHGAIKFRATKIGADTMLSQIVKMVEDAQGSKAPIQNLADKISSVFVPIVLVVAVVTIIAWVFVGSQYLTLDKAISLGLSSFVGILVIACPCALGLATPTAIIVGTGKGAENGILVKNAEGLEKLSSVDTVVMDKTGTITNGAPKVTDVIALADINENEILKILGSLEDRSEHPIGQAVVDRAKETRQKFQIVDNFKIIEGKGVTGEIKGVRYYAGNFALINEIGIDFDRNKLDNLAETGKTPVVLFDENKVLGIVAVADTLKHNAQNTVASLHKLGLKVILLTGDNARTAKNIATQAGIDSVIAEVLPNQKAQKIMDLQKKGNIVAMVGDGVNDAPALAQADVGVAMSTGTDVAIESAQITLLRGDISKLLRAIKLSKETMRTVKQNLFWAFIYNIVGIPVAAGVLYPTFSITLNPVLAGLAMAFSSVSVVSNSLRLKLKKI